MSKINDGGPAFPFVTWRSPDGMTSVRTDQGMSRRDYIAAQAVTGVAGELATLVARGSISPTNMEKIAKMSATLSYQIADAMLAAGEVES